MLKARYLNLKQHFIKKKKNNLIIYVVVLIPTLLIFLYLLLIHSSMYISESNFAIRSKDSIDMSGVGGLGGLFSAMPASTNADANILHSYIMSMDMMDKAQEKINFVDHYLNSERDIYSRLSRQATKEELLKYWRWIVSSSYDSDKGFITVYVKAYTTEFARDLNKVILENSEELVNQMNSRAHQDSLRLTKEEVDIAERRLLLSRLALQGFRDGKEILDPQETARKLEGIVSGLEVEVASIQAELSAASQTMNKKNIRIIMLTNKLKALQEQIVKEKARLAGVDNSNALSSVVGDYSQLMIEEKFAQEQLIKAMSSFEGARITAISQSRYIIPFQLPTLPDESLYPRPLLFSFVCFISLLMSLGIVSLVIAAIKDHMES